MRLKSLEIMSFVRTRELGKMVSLMNILKYSHYVSYKTNGVKPAATAL